MSVAIRAITRIQDGDDVNVTLGVGVDEYALCWDNDTAKFVLRAVSAGVTDHGALTGLADDDHAGYVFLAGRAGGQTLYGGTGANDDITIHGTSNATRTTSYVLLQPSGGNVGIGTTAPTAKMHLAQTRTDTSGIVPGVSIFDTTVSPSAHGTANIRNVEYNIQSGNTNEISSATNLVVYQYANSYMVNLVGMTVLSRYGATANVVAERLLYLSQDSKASGATVVTKTGLYIDSITHGNTNYAIYTNAGLVRFGGATSIVGSSDAVQLDVTGYTAQAGVVAQLTRNDGNTSAVANVLGITANTTGTAAAGFGAGQLFSLESSTTAAQAAARIQALWYEATHATRKADLVLTAYDTSEREGLRIRGAGSEPAIGFYGVAPIARAVLATGAGATVDNVITALQNLGLVKQS